MSTFGAVVKRVEPLCGSERFLHSFPRIGFADSETDLRDATLLEHKPDEFGKVSPEGDPDAENEVEASCVPNVTVLRTSASGSTLGLRDALDLDF